MNLQTAYENIQEARHQRELDEQDRRADWEERTTQNIMDQLDHMKRIMGNRRLSYGERLAVLLHEFEQYHPVLEEAIEHHKTL